MSDSDNETARTPGGFLFKQSTPTMTLLLKMLRTAWLAVVLVVVNMNSAFAHDPFDGNTQVIVFSNKIEAKVTLGYDAARAFARASGLPPREVARLTRPAPHGELVPLPVELASRLITLEADGRPVAATAFLVAPSDIEVNLLVTYPRPATATASLRASYFDLIEDMRSGSLVVADEHRKILATALVSKAHASATVSFNPSAASSPANSMAGFSAYFKLGVEHILTGFDHLLFLCALLISVHRIRSMVGIITAFTVAHSVTLVLAALDLVTIPPAIVEPIIAASIIAACVGNLVRREHAQDRYWMAGGFGLIHGFGFAGALREAAMATPGSGLAVPLVSFNLGVETGQLLVAALVIPVLLLGRRKAFFTRYGPAAISSVIIVVSGYWLLERLHVA